MAADGASRRTFWSCRRGTRCVSNAFPVDDGEYRAYLEGAIRTVSLGHARDPRVSDPVPEYADGAPSGQASGAKLMLLAWAAGGPIGRGESALPLLDFVEDRDPTLDPTHAAACLYESVPVSACLAPSAWPELWSMSSITWANSSKLSRHRSEAPILPPKLSACSSKRSLHIGHVRSRSRLDQPTP